MYFNDMNKTILITGASSGIGEGCARKFAAQGDRLILNERSTDKFTSWFFLSLVNVAEERPVLFRSSAFPISRSTQRSHNFL